MVASTSTSTSPVGRLPGYHGALSEVPIPSSAVIIVWAVTLNLLKDARAVNDGITAGKSERKVLEWPLKLALPVSLEDLDARGKPKMVRVEEISDLPALVSNVVVLIDWENVLAVPVEILEVELSLKSGMVITSLGSLSQSRRGGSR
jgi:hypothetical protein